MQLCGNGVQLPSDFCECISQIIPILQYQSLFIAKHCSQSFSLWDTGTLTHTKARGGTELSVEAVLERLFLASYHRALEMGTQGWPSLWKAPLSTPLEPYSAITITLDIKHTPWLDDKHTFIMRCPSQTAIWHQSIYRDKKHFSFLINMNLKNSRYLSMP